MVEGLATGQATPPPKSPRFPRGKGGRLSVAQAGVSGISARSGTTAGSGVATLQTLSGSTITAGSKVVTVYNSSDAAVDPGAYVLVDKDKAGNWWTDGDKEGSSSQQVVRFTLNEDMGATTANQAAANYVANYGGVSPVNPITVVDDGSNYSHAKSGAEGYAYNSGNGTFYVLVCDQLALQIKATLATSGTGSDEYGLSPHEANGKIVAGYTALTPFPFSQVPTSLESGTISNPLQLFGQPGDEVTLEFDQATGTYFFLQVEKAVTSVRGTAAASFTQIGTISLQNLVGLDGVAPAAPLSVENTFGWVGDLGDEVWAELNTTNGNWEARQTKTAGPLFRFTLTANHTAAGTVAADIKTMAGTAVESTTISDPEGVYVGLTNTTTGYAFKQDGVYYFDNANCPV